MNTMKSFIASLIVLTISGCTWVESSPAGEKVRVLTATDVTSCKHVGKTTVKTAHKLAGLKRHKNKIQDELTTLARNSAVDLGGDSVVAVDIPVDGRQVFEVYRCMPKAKGATVSHIIAAQ